MSKLLSVLFVALTLSACGGGDESGGGDHPNPFTAPTSVTIGINEPVVILPATSKFSADFQCSADGGVGDNTLYFLSSVWNVMPGGTGFSGVKLTGLKAGTGSVTLTCWTYADVYPGLFKVTTNVNVTSATMTSMKVNPNYVGLDVNALSIPELDFSITGFFDDGTTKIMDKNIALSGDTNGNHFGVSDLGDDKFSYNRDGTIDYVGGASVPETISYTISNGAWPTDIDNVGSVYITAKLDIVIGYPVAAELEGRWQYIHDGSTLELYGYSTLQNLVKVDANHLKGINDDGSVHHLLRAGIANVKLNGELKSFADIAASKSAGSKTGSQKGFGVIGGIGLIIGGVGCYNVQPATVTNPAGDLVPATTVGDCDDAYVDTTTGGGLDLVSGGIYVPSGTPTLIVSDEGGNSSTFSVEVVGEETDIGVLNIPDGSIEYNFKSTVQHLNDYIYFGGLPYVKNVSVCNTGTADIDGMTMAFSVDAADAALVSSFSHNDSGTATSFASGTCKTIQFSMTFIKPVADDDVKINIDITNNFTGVTWNDYASFKLSSFDSVPLYFASNTKLLNGYLVAPGRQLIKVGFSGENFNTNFIRVPVDINSEYELALSAANINDADSYMVSTLNVPNTALFTGFSDVTIYEPDDDSANATAMSYFGTEHISYLAAGDIDIYKIFNY